MGIEETDGSGDFEATRVFAAEGSVLVGDLRRGGNRVWRTELASMVP